MTLDRFCRERSADWAELGRLVSAAGRRPHRLGPEGVRTLGTTYRAVAADLALARRRWPHDPVALRLEDLVGRARHLVYASERRGASSVGHFVTTRYWRLVRERFGLVGLSALLLFGPALLTGLWAAGDPAAGAGFLPAAYRGVGEQAGGDLGLPVGTQAAFAGQVLTNNLQVSFLAFAGGIAAGVGTVVVLLFNGALLGAVAGLAFAGGGGGSFVELVAAHGALELSIIVVAGAAGLTIGRVVVDPGPASRRVALPEAGRSGAEIVLGTAPWFVLAGLIEGFVTPRGLGPGPALAFGAAVASAYWALVCWRGRPEPLP